jgi:dolichol-phosphate mannosyltransferase
LVRWLLRRPGEPDAMRRPAALGVFLLAAVWGLVFYSLAGCKRAVYVVPVLPPLALALGCYLHHLLSAESLGTLQAIRERWATQLGRWATILVLLLAMGLGALTLASGLLSFQTGVMLAVPTIGGLVMLLGRRSWRPTVAWRLCAAVMFLLLFAGVELVLPAYARKFSLRGQVRPQAEWCADCGAPIVSYPRQWDSVSFYLRRQDVTVYTAQQTEKLLERLQAEPQTVVVVKTGRELDHLLASLPATLEFIQRGAQGTVTVGLVRHRVEGGESLWADAAP